MVSKNETLNILWDNLDSDIKHVDQANQVAILCSNETMDIKYKVHINLREQEKVNEIIRVIRSQWYAVLENILKGVFDDDKIVVSEISQNVPPLVLKRLGDHVYVLQKRFLPPGDDQLLLQNKHLSYRCVIIL